MNHLDSLTILRCKNPHIATKTHRLTENGLVTEAFSAGFLFDCHLLTVSDIFDLSAKLKSIEAMDHVFAIRGLPLPHIVLNKPHPRRKHGPQATYRSPDNGHHFFMVDIDKLPLPDDLRLTPENVLLVIEFIISVLPDELQDATCHWQLSSSAGLYDKSKVSAHLWFWSKRRLTDDQLKHWAKHVNDQAGLRLIDAALFNDVQPHFTAAPIFEGMEDPFPARSGLLKKAIHDVSLYIPPVESSAKINYRRQSDDRSNLDGSGKCKTQYASGKGFEHWLEQIGDHIGGDGFNGPIIRAIASYVATHSSEQCDRAWLKATVRQRILEADASQHEAGYIQSKASDYFLDGAIDGAILKFGNKPKPRLIDEVPPHYQRKRISAVDAQRKLKAIIQRFFR